MKESYNFREMRERMVEDLRRRGIKDERVLNAMNRVQRHLFFPQNNVAHSYDDNAYSIGEGQSITQPYTVAFQTELLNVQPGDYVLEIGTGSGYQAAVLAVMGANVYSIERIGSLYYSAKDLLENLGYVVITLFGDGTKGAKEYAPFDRILVTAGAPNVSAELEEQLIEGGKMVEPVGGKNLQRMMLIEKDHNGHLYKTYHGEFKFVPLVGQYGW